MKLTDDERRSLDEKRAEAMRERRPLAYFELCVASNIDHRENIDLYREGSALFNLKRGGAGQLEAMYDLPESARYTFFKQHSENLSATLDADKTEKRRLLRLCFPRRFGVSGIQDISEYSAVDIGVIHQKLLRDAEKHQYDFKQRMS